MAVEYIYRTKRVKQELGEISIPTDNATFDEVIAYFQEQKEYWEGQVGKTFKCYDRYENGAGSHHATTEEHAFDTIYVAEGYHSMDSHDPHYVPKVFGERDMTESEIAHHDATVAAHKEQRRESYEKLKEEFEK